MRGGAALQPAHRPVKSRFRIFVIHPVLAALVELHDDVRTQRVLYLHHFFGREKVFAAVYVRIEPHALVLYIVELCEGEDLKAAAVGEDGPVPVHELVQPSRLSDQLVTGAHIEVIGVCEDDLRTRLFQIARQDALDGRLRSHGHIDGRLDIAVRRMEYARPRPRFGIGFDDFE